MSFESLKDFEGDIRYTSGKKGTGMYSDSFMVDSEKLRIEVIKWIKKDIEDYRENVQVPGNIEINSYTMFVIEKWMKRFNITKEKKI